MGRHRETLSYILRRVDYGDRDVIVTLFGPEAGKFSAIAKNARGSKRRFGGGLQPMRKLRARYLQKPNRDLARLDDIDVAEDYPELEANFDKITVGSYATDLLRKVLVEGTPAHEVFELVDGFYARLDGAEDDALVLEVLLRHFQLRLFEQLGASPTTEQCCRCGTPVGAMPKVYGLRSGEGVVCPNCTRTGEGVGVLAPATLEVLRYFAAPGAGSAEALQQMPAVEQARRFLDASLYRLIDEPLQSRTMLEGILPTPSSSSSD